MKKILGIIIGVLCLSFITVVNADERYYYRETNGGDTITLYNTVKKEDLTFTRSQLESYGGIIDDVNHTITYRGIVYGIETIVVPAEESVPPNNSGTPADAETDTNTTGNDSETKNKSKEIKAPVTDTCERLKEPLKFIGHIVTIFKILIPVILIIFGALDFFHAVTAGKDDEIKKSTKTFAFRVLAGIVIFFLPTIVSFIFSLIDSWGEFEGDFNACQKCVFRVSKCE